MKRSASFRPGFRPNSSTVRFDDGAANGQTQPHAFAFRANEGGEKLIGNGRIDARTGIEHRHANEAGLIGMGGNSQLSLRTVAHGLAGIADEIDDHLLDLDLVDEDRRGICVQIEVRFDPGYSACAPIR